MCLQAVREQDKGTLEHVPNHALLSAQMRACYVWRSHCTAAFCLAAGSVIAELLFWPPPNTAESALVGLKASIATAPAAFFTAPGFVAAYGPPDVTGRLAVAAATTLNTAQVAIGISVGLGGALLIGLAAMALHHRKRRAATATGLYDMGAQVAAADTRVRTAARISETAGR
jgi:hypothetical protein